MKKSGMRLILGHYGRELSKHKLYVLGLLLLVPIGIFCNTFASTYIVSNVIDHLSNSGRVPLDQLWSTFGWQIGLFIAAAIIGELIVWRLVVFLIWKLEIKVQFNLYNTCFEYLSTQSAQFHANKFGGSLVSQTNKFVGSYVRLADTFVFNFLPFVWTMIFTLVILGSRVPLFALALAVIATIFISISVLSYGRIARLNEAESVADTRLSGQIADMISNVMAVKSFSAEKREMQRFRELNSDAASTARQVMRATIQRDIGFAGSLTTIMLVMFLSILIGQASFGISVGTMILMLSYSLNMFNQLWQVNGIARSYNRIYGDALPMAKTLQEAVLIRDKKHPEPAQITKGQVSLQHVTFKYADSSDDLFSDLNLAIRSGERVGLVGHSGSGKTTITNLLLRFEDISGGSITIDGQDIRNISQSALREHIAYVPQQPLLFHRSLHENIAYGKPGASEKQIVQAARDANALEFIEKLSNKFETLVGERGVKLSGGQRQRVAIARAMLKDAPILVLDEATSALDSESESLIQDALWKLMEGRTALVIAHRLSTIQHMDRIIVLDNGRVVEEGSHNELLRNKHGAYAKLWARQSGGFMGE
jgi:ATP-binding cassette subfamily B protein